MFKTDKKGSKEIKKFLKVLAISRIKKKITLLLSQYLKREQVGGTKVYFAF